MEFLASARSLPPRRGSYPIASVAAFGFILVLANSLTAAPPGEPLDEYQVKAAFLFNFAKFVVWPPTTFDSPSAPINLCILGLDPFAHSLEQTLAGRLIEGRLFVLRHVLNVKQVGGCQILFISSAEDKRSPPNLEEIATLAILTIGESPVSGTDGVIINFRLDNGKVRFDINVKAANRAKLQISSRLLSLAHVTPSNQP